MTCLQKSKLLWLTGGMAGGVAGAVGKRSTLGAVLGAVLGAIIVGAFGDKMLENNSPSCLR